MTTVMRRGFALLIVPVLVARLAAADVSGVWALELDPDFGGEHDTVECRITQTGTALSIRCGAGTPGTGEIHDRRITFDMKTGEHDELTARFTAELDESGTAFKGEWHLQGGSGKISATKR